MSEVVGATWPEFELGGVDLLIGDTQRSKRLDLRRQLMTWYERTLIAARDGAAVVKIGRQKV